MSIDLFRSLSVFVNTKSISSLVFFLVIDVFGFRMRRTFVADIDRVLAIYRTKSVYAVRAPCILHLCAVIASMCVRV